MSKLFGKLLIDALRHLDDLPDDRVYCPVMSLGRTATKGYRLQASLMILYPILSSICLASDISMSCVMLPLFSGIGIAIAQSIGIEPYGFVMACLPGGAGFF